MGGQAKKPVTQAGKKLVSAIEKDAEGKKIGMRSIVNYINKALGVDVRIGKEQTTKKNPAHLSLNQQIIRSRMPLHTLMFHEAGHAISNKMDKNSPAKNAELDFSAFLHYPDTMASRKTQEEGWAEWVRRYIKNPESIAKMPLTAEIEAFLAKTAPDILDVLQDTARAYRQHLSRPVLARFRSANKDIGSAKNTIWERAKNLTYYLLFNNFGKNWAVQKFENKVFWETFLATTGKRKEAKRKAAKALAKTRQTAADFRLVHQITNRIPIEVDNAIEGEGATAGIRIYSSKDDDAIFSSKEAAVLKQAGFKITEDMTKKVKHGTLVNFSNTTIKRYNRQNRR